MVKSLQTAKKICNIASTCLLILVVIMVILLVGVRLIGLTPYTVLSGSMEPNYHVGSIIYLSKVTPENMKIGDPVTYDTQGITVTHLIIEVKNDPAHGILYKTQGDANNTADNGYIAPSQIRGKPVFTIPLLGYVANFVQNPPGIYLAVGGCIVLLILLFMSDLIFSEKELPQIEEEETNS